MIVWSVCAPHIRGLVYNLEYKPGSVLRSESIISPILAASSFHHHHHHCLQSNPVVLTC